jgi:hypothetical protein
MIRFPTPIPVLATLLAGGCAVLHPSVSPVAAGRAVAEAAAQVRRCYREPAVPTAARRIVTHLRVRYGADGALIGLPSLVSQQGVSAANQPYAERMAEAASLAVIRCSPLRLPAELHHGGWDEFDLIFTHAMLA